MGGPRRMADARLDIGSLEKAVDRLREGFDRYQRDITDTQIRDGLIQRFEFTYELSHKMLKRYLEATAASPEQYDAMPFPDLIRSANEQGLLLGDWPRWRAYREMRAKTSHTYDEDVAVAVVAGIPDFLREAVHLRDQLRARLA
jgi:nucleotidyltransferase substrate binding protein (TIGR01987 family)